MKKKLLFIETITVIMLLSGCFYKNWQGKRPCDQPNTKWIAKEKSITFTINESGSGRGIMMVNGKTIEILVAIGPATQIDIYPFENVHDKTVYGNYIESWAGDFNKSYEFTAKVEKTTYFEVGEEIIFYRIDDNLSQYDYQVPNRNI